MFFNFYGVTIYDMNVRSYYLPKCAELYWAILSRARWYHHLILKILLPAEQNTVMSPLFFDFASDHVSQRIGESLLRTFRSFSAAISRYISDIPGSCRVYDTK